MDFHISTELVVDALRIAVWRRKPAAGLPGDSKPSPLSNVGFRCGGVLLGSSIDSSRQLTDKPAR
jgi:hypothetical protein